MTRDKSPRKQSNNKYSDKTVPLKESQGSVKTRTPKNRSSSG